MRLRRIIFLFSFLFAVLIAASQPQIRDSISPVSETSIPDFEQQLEKASSHAVTAVNELIRSSQKGLQRSVRSAVPVKFDKKAISSLKKFHLKDIVFTSEANQWQAPDYTTTFFQNRLTASSPVKGIPVSFEAISTYNFIGGERTDRFAYKIRYSRETLMKELGFDPSAVKKQFGANLQMQNDVEIGKMIEKSFSGIPSLNTVVSETGSSWQEVIAMSAAEFESKYDPTRLSADLGNSNMLKNYYAEYTSSKQTVDSTVAHRAAKVDSQLASVRSKAESMQKLIALKKEVDGVMKKITAARKIYDEKLTDFLNDPGVMNELISKNEELSPLQNFMLKVKSINVGQHTISTGNLVLKNYLQNGITFEYENDKFFFLVTKGSQEKVEYTNGFFPSMISTNGITEYHRYENRYRLTGASFGRTVSEGNYQQVSAMRFENINRDGLALSGTRDVDVITIGNKFTWLTGKLAYDISKSITKPYDRLNPDGTITRIKSNGDLLNTIGVDIKYETLGEGSKNRHKLNLFYNSLLYNNPGLNGFSRPGIQFAHTLDRKTNSRYKIKNGISYYSFNYGNGNPLTTLRERFDIRYKLKTMSVGLLVNSGFTGSKRLIKSSTSSRTLDILGTIEARKRFNLLFVNVNAGTGIGSGKQEGFSSTKDYSFYVNSGFSYRKFSLEINADKFQTNDAEVFFTDSTAFILSSTFTLGALAAYSNANGDFFQVGVQHKQLNHQDPLLFVTGNLAFTIKKRIVIGGTVNLPLSGPLVTGYYNNSFNTKLVYNIY
jgi:hypothetical protein